jgi:hypothetical protein
MKDGLIDITFVLDRSGSMSSCKDDTIGGFNSYISSQKDLKEGQVLFTLVQFDHEYDVVHRAKKVSDIPELNLMTFYPRGNTALLDAIGRSIEEAGQRFSKMKEEDKPEKVIFVILTDGQENSSKEYNIKQINEMISHQQSKYSWEFIFLGANQDAISTGCSLGISVGKSMTYSQTSIGTKAVFDSISRITTNYRGKKYDKTDFSEEERKLQEDNK